ncbi:hypothetical protein DEO72_LG8g1988 [Vigna unguiculata]|uniref:Uncharacterized protein n=1 Tax=Vigna unguiculata TaxID=3917 RepID=A0A4D6MR35_VIGUN|nr:hypothetical protein DEO72_LG8g1988 [Vigna unguiculata]
MARWSWRDGAGAEIATTEVTTWLNRRAESIGTLNLGFRWSWRDKDRETEWRDGAGATARRSWCNGTTELARRRLLQRRLRHGLITERNRL